MQRFAPLNSWPDNANLDKARRLLWPVKQKYGNKISWADLLVFAGNAALESAGFETFGFAFGRPDFWEPEEVIFGEEERVARHRQALLRRRASARQLEERYGATTMGLIYVNPEGPEGKPDPLAAAHRHPRDVRPDGDERRGDRGADRRRPHPRQDPRRRRRRPGGSRARGCPDRAAGPGLEVRRSASGKAGDSITSGLEVVWTPTPTQWSNAYLEILYGNEWELTKSPAGAWQFEAKDAEATIPDPFGGPQPQAHDAGHRHLDAGGPDLRRDHPALAGPSRGAATRRSPRPGTSCCTATWARSAATSGRGSPSRSCGRTRCPPSKAS